MKVINLFAGPGAGKSTTAAGLFHKMKLDGYNVELVTEYAKDLTWEQRHNVLIYDQLYVTANQNRRLVRINDQVDYAITDSPLLLGFLYKDETYLPNSYDNLLIELFHQYDNMCYFIERYKKYNPAGRNQSESEAREIDNRTKELLDRLQVQYKSIPGTEEAIDLIYKDIKSQ